VTAVLIGGCGGGSEDATVGGGARPGAGGGGTLVWAAEGPVSTLDPLFARTPAERLVARQIYSPLIERLDAPFGGTRRLAGLAVMARETADPTLWRVRIRPGVRFQDGTPVNAAAVIANAERWQAYPELSGLPPRPELFVFSPKPPYEVRFKLSAANPDFDRVLASPALGLVSPAAVERAGVAELGLAQAPGSGSGAFELRERDAGSLLLAPDADWWGSERGLGPGLDQLGFVLGDPAGERAVALREGGVQVASELPRRTRRRLGRDPLLTVISEGDGIAGERSVRGVPDDEAVPALSGVWRTRLGGG
jgi:peptide/nickel transport system substrate-binding protein